MYYIKELTIAFKNGLKLLVNHVTPVPGPAQSKRDQGISLCSCSRLSLPSKPHSLVSYFFLL